MPTIQCNHIAHSVCKVLVWSVLAVPEGPTGFLLNKNPYVYMHNVYLSYL